MLDWSDEQLEEAGLDPARVRSIVRRFRRLSSEMQSMGLHVYGNAGTGLLIHESRPTHRDDTANSLCGVADHDSTIANLGPGFDGGDW
jgi:hypothetical protein